MHSKKDSFKKERETVRERGVTSALALFPVLTCIIAWVALILQFYLIVVNAPKNGETEAHAISRFFSYFTILTNFLVAIGLSYVLWFRGAFHNFFSKATVQTATAVYIFTVGLSYNILLRHIWKPQGLQFIADELLHVVVPLLYVLYWFLFVRKERLAWKNVFGWMAYPALYLAYALLRARLDGLYPYYFIDAGKLGYATVFVNAGFLFLAFIIISLLFIAITQKRKSE